jgi:Fe-S oxidoreductase
VAGLEAVLPFAAKAPRLVNALTHNWVAQRGARLLGLTALPELGTTSLRAELARRGFEEASPAALRTLGDEQRRRCVVVVQDAFTSHYESEVVLDFFDLLHRLGFEPRWAPFLPNGKPQHVLGMLGPFRRTAARNAVLLRSLADTGVDLVGLEPSMTLAYRAEYPKALGADAVPHVALPQEWLARRLDELPELRSEPRRTWKLLPHCTERTNAPAATSDWVKVARHFGLELEIVASGCCGMAGLYGHEVANRKTSESIYAISWGPILEDPSHLGRISATGYSCRCQAKLMGGVRLDHPLQVLLRLQRAHKTDLPKYHRAPATDMVAVHHEED